MPQAALLGQAEAPALAVNEDPRTTWLVPKCKPGHTNRPPTPVAPARLPLPLNIPAQGEQDSFNWSGFVDYADNAGEANETSTTPFVRGDHDVASSTWAGLGSGSSNGDMLLQAGTEADGAYGAPGNYYAWWEEYPRNTQQVISNLGSAANHNVYAGVAHTGYGQGLVIINDHTINQGTEFYVYWPAAYTIGHQADWIFERTEENGYYPKLTNTATESGSSFFGGVIVTGVTATINGNSTGTPLGQLRRFYLYMKDCRTGQYMAKTGNISPDGTSFPVNWLAYGTQETC